ncbi:MAG: hypothetical protein CM1200mP18_03000 [Gammaproteobacteria bacterium]|nr:MAG: hypothetical protein CM1200mP18_03000 [Gammaproteobacteria bacterium]
MPTVDPLILDTCSRLFTEQCSPAVVNAAEEGDWPVELWTAIEAAGLSLAWVPEKYGGCRWFAHRGFFAISRAAAAHAVPVPLAETLLAGWLLAEAGLDCPIGPMSVSTTVLTLDSEQRFERLCKTYSFRCQVKNILQSLHVLSGITWGRSTGTLFRSEHQSPPESRGRDGC